MSIQISVAEARKHFAEITTNVAQSGGYTILKNGKPIAELIPIGQAQKPAISPELPDWLEKFTTQYAEDLQELAQN